MLRCRLSKCQVNRNVISFRENFSLTILGPAGGTKELSVLFRLELSGLTDCRNGEYFSLSAGGVQYFNFFLVDFISHHWYINGIKKSEGVIIFWGDFNLSV